MAKSHGRVWTRIVESILFYNNRYASFKLNELKFIWQFLLFNKCIRRKFRTKRFLALMSQVINDVQAICIYHSDLKNQIEKYSGFYANSSILNKSNVLFNVSMFFFFVYLFLCLFCFVFSSCCCCFCIFLRGGSSQFLILLVRNQSYKSTQLISLCPGHDPKCIWWPSSCSTECGVTLGYHYSHFLSDPEWRSWLGFYLWAK